MIPVGGQRGVIPLAGRFPSTQKLGPGPRDCISTFADDGEGGASSTIIKARIYVQMIVFKLLVIWFDGCVETREFNNALAGIKKLCSVLRTTQPSTRRRHV
jgi:hypothetical protein